MKIYSNLQQKNYIASAVSLLALFLATLACSSGGGGSSPVADPTILTITPTNEKAVESDGAGLLPEERDGSGKTDSDTAPVLLGTISYNKNTNDKAVYKLATDDDAVDTNNASFSIYTTINTGTGMATSQLFYIGSALDFESTSDAKKSFSLKIERYNNQEAVEAEGGGNPQILQYIVNLKDLEEVLTITPTDGEAIASDGVGLLDENADGSGTPIEIGTIDDTIQTSTVVSYRLAEDGDNNNDQFQIDDGKLYYIGTNAGDFEASDKLIAEIIRTLDDNAATDQTLQYTINLKNLNDNAPAIKGYLADGTTEIGYIAADNVGAGMATTSISDVATQFALAFAMALKVPAADQQITIDFAFNPIPGFTFGIAAQNADGNSAITGEAVNKFIITMNPLLDYTDLVAALNGENEALRDPADAADFSIWDSLQPVVTYLGPSDSAYSEDSPASGEDLFKDSNNVTLTGKKGIVVAAGETGIIADFDDNDPDGDLVNSFAYSLSGIDADAFTINSSGELSFQVAPIFATGTNADNIYDITVTVSDGTFSDTYDLQIVVVP